MIDFSFSSLLLYTFRNRFDWSKTQSFTLKGAFWSFFLVTYRFLLLLLVTLAFLVVFFKT